MSKSSNNSKIKELERDIKVYNRDIRKDPEDASFYDMKADALTELGKLKNDASYYEQALECRNQTIKLDPENSSYLTTRSKLHIVLGRNDLAAKDITEAQKSPDTGNSVLNMYNINTTQDILKLDGVQNEVKGMIARGELPPALSEAFNDMIGVITGISTRVSVHDDRLNEHDDRFEKDEARLKEVEERLVSYEKQYPALSQIIESMKTEIGTLQSRLITQEKKVDEHDVAIASLRSTATEAMKDLEQKLSKAPNYNAVKQELDEIGRAVNSLLGNKDVSEKQMAIVVESIQDLQTAKDLNTDRVLGLRKKIQSIEVELKAQAKIEVGIVNEITYDNELLNYPELFARASKTLGAEKSLELGKYLSTNLLKEAASADDPALVLAGLMSLDHSDHSMI